MKKMKPVLVMTLLSVMAGCGGSSGSDAPSLPPTQVIPPVTPVADTSPDAFIFAELSNVGLAMPAVSESVEVSGIDSVTSLSIDGGEYSINGGEFTGENGSVVAGDSIQVRVTSSGESEEITTATITVGDYSTSFSVITMNIMIIEAESTILVGNVSVLDEQGASGDQVVNGFLQPTDGIEIESTSAVVAMRVSYKATSDTNLLVSINDGEQLLIPIIGAEEFSSVIVENDLAEGDKVFISQSNGDSGLEIDSVEWVDFPFEQVRTFANSGVREGDGISVSADGDIYVSGGLDNGSIIKIDKSGETSIFTTGFASANGSDFDSLGNLFVADYTGNRVYKVTPEGVNTVFASNLNGPAGVFVDQSDNVIVGVFGANFSGDASQVLTITPQGEVSVLASGGGLRDVIGVVGDENGDIYAGNWSTGQVFRVSDGNVVLLGDLDANLNQIDYSRGYIYVATSGRVSRVSTDGQVAETFVGSSTQAEIDGPVSNAEFAEPNAITASDNGNTLYVYDKSTGNVRSITFADE